MEYFADSPRFVRRRFHAEQEHLTHIQHSDTCRCLKCAKFARTAPKLGIQIPDSVLEEVNKNRVSLIDPLVCAPATTSIGAAGSQASGAAGEPRGRGSPAKSSKTVVKKEVAPARKYRDLQWLMMKMKGSVIVGVNTLYKDERGRQSYDIQLSTVVDPSGASRAGASDDATGASRKNELVEKMNQMVHRVLFPDTIFFDRGKPTQYFLTCNMDEDVSSAGQSGTESTVKMKSSGVSTTTSDEQEKKKEAAKKKKELKKQLESEVCANDEANPNAKLLQRTLTALVKLRSSSELITIVRDFLRRALVLRRKQSSFEKLIQGMVKEALMSDEELHQAMIQNLNPRLVLNPYRYFLVPGKEGEHYCGEMEGITVYLPPNAPEGPNGLAMVHAQKQFIKHAYTNKRGIVPRQMNLELKAPPGAQQPGPHAVSTAVNPYDESMEMLRIQYKDGTVRLWSDREVRMFCVLRKPNRQEFLDIQAVQILPFAGMHQTPQSLQFVTYNYNEKLIALKTKMRARSPKKDKVVYDPVPARPLSPKRPVPLPFDKAKQQDEEEEPPAAAAAKKEKKQKSKDKAAGDKSPEKGAAGAGEQNKDKAADKDKHDENKHGSSKEHASPSKDKHGGAGHHSPLLQTPPPYDPLTSPHLSPDLELMKGFFPEAHVVVAEQYDDGKIYFHEEEATRIRALQRSLSPERYGKKGKRKAKPVLESSPESPGSKEKSVKIMGSEQHGGSKSSTAGAGNQNHAGSSKERASTQSPPPAIKTPGGAAAKHADAPSTPTKSQHQQPHGSPKAAEAAPAAAPAAAGAPPPEMHTGPKKKHEPLEHLGEIPETHFYMKNNEREELMEETIDKLNGWLTEKYGLRIFSGVFEFAFAKIDVPSKEFQRVSAKKNSVQAIMAEKKQQRIKKTPKQVVEELQETRLRCYLMNAAKLLVGKAERKKKKEDRPSSRGSSPSPYASEADEDMYAYDSPGDDSQGQTSPGADSSPGGPSEAATDAQSPAAQRKKRPKWRTEAGPEMLTNMIDLWEPIRLECSTDPLAEFKNQLSQSTGKSKSGDTDKNSVEMMVRATVDAAREGTPFDHVPFLKEIPAQCHDKLVESKIDLFQKEHTVTEKTRVGPIGAMLRKPLLPGVVGGNLPRTNSEPVMSGHALSHRGRSTGTPVKMNQYGGSGGPSMSHGAPHGMMMNGNNNFSSTTPNTANNFLGHAPIVPMGSTGGIMMGSHPTSGRQLLSAGTNSSKFSAGVPQMSSTPGSRVHTRPTSIAQNVVQQQMMQTTNTSSTPSRSRKELPKNSMEKVDVSRIFLGGENLHLIQTKNSDAGRAVPPDEFTILSPRRKDIGRTTTDSLSDLLGGSKTREK